MYPGSASGRGAKRRRSKRSQWVVTQHLAQLSLNVGAWERTQLFVHWVLFDDLWASANADLANALFCAASRWDVLSSPRRRLGSPWCRQAFRC